MSTIAYSRRTSCAPQCSRINRTLSTALATATDQFRLWSAWSGHKPNACEPHNPAPLAPPPRTGITVQAVYFVVKLLLRPAQECLRVDGGRTGTSRTHGSTGERCSVFRLRWRGHTVSPSPSVLVGRAHLTASVCVWLFHFGSFVWRQKREDAGLGRLPQDCGTQAGLQCAPGRHGCVGSVRCVCHSRAAMGQTVLHGWPQCGGWGTGCGT